MAADARDVWNPDQHGRFREERAAFLARYRARLAAVLPGERPFVYTYRRLFRWGRRP